MRQIPEGETTRIAVVGTGHVGATFAYSLLLSGLAAEIVLVNRTREKAEGEAMDLRHAEPFTHRTKIWAGDFADLKGAAVTVLTAGAPTKTGETRLDLAKKNSAIFKELIPQVVKHNPDGLLVITSNPVDVLTYVTWKVSGLPAGRVIGSGTVLDTARFRALLSRHLGVDPHSIQAYIIGEHGDSEVPVWSMADIAGIPLGHFCETQGATCDLEARARIFQDTRDAAYRIVEQKGATYYGIATGLVQITKAIVRDQHTVLSVSSLLRGYYGIDDVCLSLPAVLGREGVERVLHMPLADSEIEALRRSAQILKEHISEAGF
jgi:L-lactate dehydrogenase